MIDTERVVEMTRDLLLGTSKDEVATTPEESALCDLIQADIDANPDAVIDLPSEHPPLNYASGMWGAPVTDDQIANLAAPTTEAPPDDTGEPADKPAASDPTAPAAAPAAPDQED